MDEHQKGLLLLLFGSLAVSPDAALVLWSRSFGATNLMIVLWKLVFTGLLYCVHATIFEIGATDDGLARLGIFLRKGTAYFVGFAVCNPVTLGGLALGFCLTYAANTLLLFSLNLMWSAVFGYVFLDDELPPKTFVAIFFTLFGLAIVLSSSVSSFLQGNTEVVLGDLCGLVAGLSIATYLTVSRSAKRRMVELERIPHTVADGFGCLFFALLTWIAGKFLMSGKALPDNLFALVPLAISGVAIVSCMMSYAIATKVVSAANISLFTLLEVFVGPIITLIAFQQKPPNSTWIGGAIICVTLVAHESHGIIYPNGSEPLKARNVDVDGASYEAEASRLLGKKHATGEMKL